jgi:hypothetical protein
MPIKSDKRALEFNLATGHLFLNVATFQIDSIYH